MRHDLRSNDVRLLVGYLMVFSMESHQLMCVIAITFSIILTSLSSVLSTTRNHTSKAFFSPQSLRYPGYITLLPS
jgi:hypothetical protein